jgi:hypothetical protein
MTFVSGILGQGRRQNNDPDCRLKIADRGLWERLMALYCVRVSCV